MAKLKLTPEGHAVVQDGKPVFEIDGKDVVFDYSSTLGTITRLNGEARAHREAKEAALSQLKAFDGIEDAEAARKALGVVKNLDEKKLIDAGEVDRVRSEAVKAVEDKYRPVVKERDTLQASLHREVIGGAFARSKFIGEKLAVPLPMVEATFGSHFALDGGKLVAKDASGNQIYSRARPGEVATFDEALEVLVDTSPFRDSILKGTGASGSGAHGSSGNAGSKALPRAAFEALGATDRMAHIKAGGTVTE